MDPTSTTFVTTFTTIPGTAVTEEQLHRSALLFSHHYAVWSDATQKSHAPVKMSTEKLRDECLSTPEKTVLVTCTMGDKLVGHAFATTWEAGSDIVGWVTQLVVDKDYRRRYIATSLVQQLKNHPLFKRITLLGVATSNPATCVVIAKYACIPMEKVDTSFIAKKAPTVLKSSPVQYIKKAQLRGSLFQDQASADGAVSSVNTNFPIDHTETLAVLEKYKSQGKWPLGDLLEGHEFLMMVPVAPSTWRLSEGGWSRSVC